ncbi:MAG: Lsr2 family protein, partial [Actinomycetota bacterium]|nr:Lsr2 family protein [Actinomycetota bacterium]
TKVYCHAADAWPADAEVVERVPVRSCVRRGAAIDLVLDRGRENRSQVVFTRIRGGRQAIFWQSARTAKQARPNVALPTARAAGIAGLEILVDSHERYAWKFTGQQATTVPRGLVAGDYGVELDGHLVATVERKSLADLVATLTAGKMRYVLADLAAVGRAAVVVEARYSEVFKLTWVRPAVVADAVAECQVRFPGVPIVFCDTRALAQEWTYRFLAAALAEAREDTPAGDVVAELPAGRPVTPPEPSVAQVRAWARQQGYAVSDRGRLRPEVWAAYHDARQAHGC